MANKTSQIIELLTSDEKLTQREISRRVECTEGYVSKVKREITKKEKEKSSESLHRPMGFAEDPEDDELEKETAEFVKKIKIVPPSEVLTDGKDEPEDTDEEYECGACGHVWTADKGEYQTSCPKCGEEF